MGFGELVLFYFAFAFVSLVYFRNSIALHDTDCVNLMQHLIKKQDPISFDAYFYFMNCELIHFASWFLFFAFVGMNQENPATNR